MKLFKVMIFKMIFLLMASSYIVSEMNLPAEFENKVDNIFTGLNVKSGFKVKNIKDRFAKYQQVWHSVTEVLI